MTREDAIICLKGIKNLGNDMFTEKKDFLECLEMAIKELEHCEDQSEKRYTRLFDALKFNWMINCEHDDKLTDKIERCEAALTTLKNLGFNLVNGEVENV